MYHEPPKMTAKTVLICGAGPAGVALAYLLASRGFCVRLFEQHHDFARVFRGEGFQPSGIDALRQMGLGAQVAALPSAQMKEVAIWHKARLLATLRAAETEIELAARVISQPALLEMLVAEAAKFPGFQIERGVTVRDLVHENGRVVGVRIERGGSEEEIRGRLVIGTDGRNSVIRRKAGLHEEKSAQAFDLVWCRVPLPPFWPDRGHAEIFLVSGGAVIAFPSYGGALQLGLTVQKGAYKQLRGQGLNAWLDELARLVRPELSAYLAANRGTISAPFVLDVVCDHLTHWTAPGLLLIGDAAHPMSPVGGQGVNVALRDVLVAANYLCPVLARNGSPEEIDAAIACVQRERQPEVFDIQRLQTQQARFMLSRGVLAWLLRTALPLLAKVPPVRGFVVRSEQRFAKVLRPIRLQV